MDITLFNRPLPLQSQFLPIGTMECLGHGSSPFVKSFPIYPADTIHVLIAPVYPINGRFARLVVKVRLL